MALVAPIQVTANSTVSIHAELRDVYLYQLGGQRFKGFGGGGMPKNDMASKEEEENIWCVKEAGSTCPGGKHMSLVPSTLLHVCTPKQFYLITCLLGK